MSLDLEVKWNVYRFNINRQKIEVFNIFEHCSFTKYVKEALLKYEKNIDRFTEQLKSELMYYFWGKSEYEVIITCWVGGDREKVNQKIDIYDQVMMNWDKFVDYVWNNGWKLLVNEE